MENSLRHCSASTIVFLLTLLRTVTSVSDAVMGIQPRTSFRSTSMKNHLEPSLRPLGAEEGQIQSLLSATLSLHSPWAAIGWRNE